MKLKSLIIFFVFLCVFDLKAQELKYLAGAPNLPVKGSCTDSIGNLYTLLNGPNQFGLVYQYNRITRQWSHYAQMDSLVFESHYSSTCVFLYGELIVTGQHINNPNVLEIVKIRNTDTSEQVLQTIVLPSNFASVARIQAKKFNNKIYYTGDYVRTSSFPNISNSPMSVLVFNGSFFESQYPLRSNKLDYDFYLDSLRFTNSNSNAIVTYSVSDTSRPVFFQDKFALDHILAQDTNIYFTRDKSNVIELVKMGVQRNQSTLTLNPDFKYFKLFNVNNRRSQLYLSNSRSYNDFIEFSGVNASMQYQRHFRIQVEDTIPLQVIPGRNVDYLFHPKGLIKNGINYGYIAQLEYDSLKNVSLDSILVMSYRDVNRNNTYDIGDVLVPCRIQEAVSNRTYQTDLKGMFAYTSYDNEDVNFSVISELDGASCFAQPFSGGLSSKASFSSKSRDTLYIPLWDQFNDSINYRFDKFYSKQARIDDVIPIELNVLDKICNNNTDSVYIDIYFDDSLKIISSSAIPSAVNGNHYTFRSKPSSGFNTQFKFEVKYPFGVFQLGKKVRHNVVYQYKKESASKTLKDSIVQLMVYSYDPNIKYSEPEGRVKDGVKIINYFIHFQNEGNADAFRVRVVDTLNLKMPIYQFKMLGSSHPYKLSHYDNIVTWTFDNINLKPKSIDEARSKGYVAFQAYTRGDLAVGDSIINTAAIFFDLNEPIITKESIIKRYDDSSSVFSPQFVKGIKAYPNPGEEKLIIENLSPWIQTIKIYNSIGQLMQIETLYENDMIQIDTEYWSTGVYLLVNDTQTVLKWIKL